MQLDPTAIGFGAVTFPTIQEELERKAFEQLERLAVQLEHGVISEAQFDTGVMSVWHCVSGLVGKDTTELISGIKTLKTVGIASYTDSRVFTKGKHLAILIRNLGDYSVHLTFGDGEKSVKNSFKFRDELHPSKAALEKQNSITETLLKTQWIRRI